MADDEAGERSEEATEKKLRESAEKGQIARSKELNTAALTIASTVALLMEGEHMTQAFIVIMQNSFSLERSRLFDVNMLTLYLSRAIVDIGWALLPFFSMVLMVALLAPMALGGFNFSWSAIAPKANRMSPMKGFKRMFGTQAAMELFKALAKVLVIGFMAWFILWGHLDQYMSLDKGAVIPAMTQAITLLGWSFFLLSLPLLIIVLFDVPFQIWNHAKELKMTKQEVKDEFKETEGKPEVKNRIRQVQRQIAERRMMSEVPKADVVITNPSHYAIALKYDQSKPGAPILVAKGLDLIALQIRKIADEHQVEVLESPPLARSIYYHTKLEQEIPEGLYIAVAQVLAYVHQLRLSKSYRATRPKKLGVPVIPQALQHD